MRRDDDRPSVNADVPREQTGVGPDFPPSDTVPVADARARSALGGVGGAAVGAAVGAAAGPIGVVIGALAGGLGGWWAGHAMRAAGGLQRDEPWFREHHESLGEERGGYERARLAYQLGYLASRNPEYASRDFDEIEARLRVGWTPEIEHMHGEWGEAREYARAAYRIGRERDRQPPDREVAIRPAAGGEPVDGAPMHGGPENVTADTGAQVAGSAEEGEVVYPSELDALANGIPAEPASEAVREFGISEAEVEREAPSASSEESIVDPREGETRIGEDLRAEGEREREE